MPKEYFSPDSGNDTAEDRSNIAWRRMIVWVALVLAIIVLSAAIVVGGTWNYWLNG